jgi:phosphatidylglycerol---prolipoprotein diacylglyceryl transferase
MTGRAKYRFAPAELRVHRYAYSVFLYIGILAGVFAGTYCAALHGLNATQVYVCMLLLVAPALVGARLLFVASHWRLYRPDPRRLWRRSEGGAALYGGLILSFVVSLPLLRLLRLSLAAFWDAAAIAMLAGMVLVRVGCLINGCCAGRPTARWFGLDLPGPRGVRRRRVPTQLMEAALALTLLLAATRLWNRLPFDGMLFLGVLAVYSVARWWLESAKEVIDTIGTVSIHRALSAVLLAVSVTGLVLMWRHSL